MKKFTFTGETLDFDGVTLRRIQRNGERGGWIEKESNLQQNGWIDDNAKVYGDAVITGDAQVFSNASVFGNAVIDGNARVSGKAKVYGHAQVYDYARVYDNAEVYDDASVFDEASVFGYAKVFGRAEVWSDTDVCGRSEVSGGTGVSRKNQNNLRESKTMNYDTEEDTILRAYKSMINERFYDLDPKKVSVQYEDGAPADDFELEADTLYDLLQQLEVSLGSQSEREAEQVFNSDQPVIAYIDTSGSVTIYRDEK